MGVGGLAVLLNPWRSAAVKACVVARLLSTFSIGQTYLPHFRLSCLSCQTPVARRGGNLSMKLQLFAQVRRKMSAEGRARTAAAQEVRWAKTI